MLIHHKNLQRKNPPYAFLRWRVEREIPSGVIGLIKLMVGNAYPT